MSKHFWSESTGVFVAPKSGAPASELGLQLQGEIFRTFLAFCGMQYLNSSFLLGGSQKVPINVGEALSCPSTNFLNTDPKTEIEQIDL